METFKKSLIVIGLAFFVSFAVMAPTLRASMEETEEYWKNKRDEFDEYWKQRADQAQKAALESFHPDPLNVTDHFNFQVQKAMEGSNNTRRNLGGKKVGGGPCLATNPIDRCWRCDPNWEQHRQKLADCVLGFGRKTTGGKGGKYYVVTDPSDNDMLNPKSGTLRHAVIQKEPLWIIFARSMIIRLNQELMMSSHKTIDGRGVNVQIVGGAGITIQFVQNVIIHGLHIHDIVPGNGGLIRDSVDHYGFRTRSDGDGISLFGASNVWIDHNSMSKCSDGIVDAIMGSTSITISNNHITDHNEVMLFGASDSYSGDKIMQVTVAFNHFGKGLVQRMPRCRWGFFHVVNNDYTHWLMYAIGGSQAPTIISEGNRFIAPDNAFTKEITKRDYATPDQWKNWNWRSNQDLLMNGATFTQSGNSAAVQRFSRQDVIAVKPGTMVTRLTRNAGALDCFKGRPC